MGEWSELKLIAVALALGGRSVSTWSSEEAALAEGVPLLKPGVVGTLRDKIRRGLDPLGEFFCQLRSAETRRQQGATYTPKPIIHAMLNWAQVHATPTRIIDPGAGSARFMIEAGRRFRNSRLIGIEKDPLVALIARGNLAAAGLAERAEIIVGDYRQVELGDADGETLFIGNPPYVRHHLIQPEWKDWLAQKARILRVSVSQLAGLHVHFYLATALKGKHGDFGCFITSAEWLDVNYGKLIRDLFMEILGGRSVVVIEPTARPFPDAATTAAIVTFQIGNRPSSVFLKRVDDLDGLKELESGRRVRRERLENEGRWSHFTRIPREKRVGYVELGELCRVHRGQATGLNKFWIEGPHSAILPSSVLFPTVTRARELFAAGRELRDDSKLRRVIDIPGDLAVFGPDERIVIDRFLNSARLFGASEGYIARNRKAWWSVGLREPAPILASYMARRPPAFVRNLALARHLNIAHGLYPRDTMAENTLLALVNYLSQCVSLTDGRTYAGGLTKFEPREMERILVPNPQMLNAYAI